MTSLIYYAVSELLQKHVALISAIGTCVVLCEFQDMLPGSGTVSLHVHNQPAAEAVRSIEWQGWIKIVSNVDGADKVNLDLDQVSVPIALEEISRQTHSHWNWAWFVARNPHEISEGEEAFADKSSLQAVGWSTFSKGMAPVGGCHNLQENLKTIADAQGTPTIVPSNWNPVLLPMDSAGQMPMYPIVPDLAAWAGGSSEEVIILQKDSMYQDFQVPRRLNR